MRIRSQKLKSWITCLIGLSVVGSSVGCSRSFWRQQADADTYQAITEHLTDQRWAVPRIDLTPDPRSRFYDPYDPDSAPLPPDDPAAHTYMHWVNGWEGYKCWHQFGDLMSVENPQWLAQFGFTPEMIDEVTGEYIAPVPQLENVKLVEAVELSQIHNRDYQFELENLFLTALAVTFERYQLGVRYLEPTGGVSGTLTEGGGLGRFNVNSIGVSQSLPWGTQLVTSLANTTLWSFGAGGQSSSVSTLSFQILQPLLNDAGRKVNLENLTQIERDLLYQARNLARFRKELFTDIVQDYLGLLQQFQAIRNEEGNIERLREQLERLLAANQPEFSSANVEVADLGADFEIPEELQHKLDYRLKRLIWRGLMTAEEEQIFRNIRPDPEFQAKIDELKSSLPNVASGLNVLQVQFDLTNSVNRLRGQERALQDSLDSFKISLGLPPDMQMTINDRMLKPFEVIDPRLTEQEELIKDFIEELYVDNATEPPQLKIIATNFSAILETVKRDVVDVIGDDLDKFKTILPTRLETLEEPSAKAQLLADFTQVKDRYEAFLGDFGDIEAATKAIIVRLEQPEIDEVLALQLLSQLIDMRQDLLLKVQSAAVIQVSSRVELIDIAKFDVSLDEATYTAVDQRLDLMNSRARVMDARRRVEVIANDLKSVLDVGIDGSLSTPSGETNPFDFRSDTGQLTASLSFDTPLDQINERNAYREALIAYQRQRRNYMAAEDEVKSSVRSAWRQLNVLKQNLETSRLAVRIAALQYESAVAEGAAPKDPRQVANSGSSGVEGQNLTRALSSILQAQNQLISNYVSYERNRLNIYRDMGIMDIGPDGIWNDPVYRNLDRFDEEAVNNGGFNEDKNINENDSAVRQLNGLDRGGSRVSLLGGSRPGDEDDEPGIVELHHVLGRLGENPEGSADHESGARPFPTQFVGARESR